jgi:hypothetical protein
MRGDQMNAWKCPKMNEKNGKRRERGRGMIFTDMKILSLFANVGIAEAYMKEIGEEGEKK